MQNSSLLGVSFQLLKTGFINSVWARMAITGMRIVSKRYTSILYRVQGGGKVFVATWSLCPWRAKCQSCFGSCEDFLFRLQTLIFSGVVPCSTIRLDKRPNVSSKLVLFPAAWKEDPQGQWLVATVARRGSVYSFSKSCPKTVFRAGEVFPTGSTMLLRLQLDCAHWSRRACCVFFFFWRESACPK